MRHYTGLALGVGGGYVLCRTAAILIRKYFITKLTALNEFAEIGTKSTRKFDKLRGTAVICGGSIAGLLTAKVCSDHFEDVIIVEAEEWVTTPESCAREPRKELFDKKRSHISQYKAAHNYQPLLVATLLKWFPNVKEEIQKLGGKLVPPEYPASLSGLPIQPVAYPKGYTEILMMRRSVFETLIRSLILNSCKNVCYMAGTAVGLEQSSGSGVPVITGVRVRNLLGEESILPTVLAVDCTGAGASGFRWLRELAATAGNEKAVQKLDNLRQTYNPKQSYRTCNFVVPPDLVPRLIEIGYPQWDLSGFVYAVLPDPKLDSKFLGITVRDNNYCEYVLGGWAVDDEISTIQDIRTYLSSLKLYKPLPDLAWKTLDLFEEYTVPLSVETTRLGTAVYIQYNLYDNLPSNFIAIGDSVMKVNPIKAVGCTKACIEALSLNGLLNKCYPRKGRKTDDHDVLPKDFSKRFFKLQAARTGSSWNSYKAEDYAYATTVPSKGDDPQKYGKSQRDFGRLIIQSLFVKDNELSLTFANVRGFLAPPTDLFSPSVLLKLLWIKLFEKSPLL
ncbi:hypothetical protein Clacol_004679 [Clathrus columnatus]|uniref:Uncharacterized protein n=1 Tax=Clathrus columnatus TaxID=1419009 RepID=A0AAV5ACT2_9AGAM|nr:hypothetical protein Clacol_004679 [Clathrus columnatus]